MPDAWAAPPPPPDPRPVDAHSDQQPHNAWVRWLLRVLLVAALSVSLYLAWNTWQAETMAGCVGTSGTGCEDVLQSRWSQWFGLPVAALASSVYLSALVLSLFLGAWVPRGPARLAWHLLTMLAAGILIAVLWFVGLQLFVLEAFCPWCLAAHATGGTAAVLVLLAAPLAPRWKMAGAVLGVLLTIVLLPIGQLAGSPTRYELERIVDRHGLEPFRFQRLSLRGRPPRKAQDEDGPGNLEAAAEGHQDESQGIVLLDGLLQLDPARHPQLGAAKGSPYVVMLFDYRCSHCRRLNRYLRELRERRDPSLNVIPLPTPMDRACNPHAAQSAAYGKSCELARLALAVWQARPDVFAEFHQWLLAGDEAPAIKAARDEAERLVGEARLRNVLDKESVDDRLGQHVELYGLVGAGPIPKLLLPGAIMSGTPDSAAVLRRLLDEELRGAETGG